MDSVVVVHSSQLSLSIKRAKLRFVLKESILVILQRSLVVQVDVVNTPGFAFGLCILVSIFHLFVSILHVTRIDGLTFVLKRTTQHILRVLHIKTVVAL